MDTIIENNVNESKTTRPLSKTVTQICLLVFFMLVSPFAIILFINARLYNKEYSDYINARGEIEGKFIDYMVEDNYKKSSPLYWTIFEPIDNNPIEFKLIHNEHNCLNLTGNAFKYNDYSMGSFKPYALASFFYGDYRAGDISEIPEEARDGLKNLIVSRESYCSINFNGLREFEEESTTNPNVYSEILKDKSVNPDRDSGYYFIYYRLDKNDKDKARETNREIGDYAYDLFYLEDSEWIILKRFIQPR